jgi:DegV family protein with EDD domain
MKYSYAIFADVSGDLNPEVRTRFEVDGYIKSFISTPDENDIEARCDLTDAEIDAFYVSLKANQKKYKTSSSSVEKVVESFETFLQQGKDILALAISSALSATYNIMVCAQKIVEEKYPERKVMVIDSMKYSLGLGLLTVKACELRAGGCTIEQNAERLEKLKKTLHQMGPIDDLFWVASKGRISHAKAFFGTIAGIRALGDFGPEGMVATLAKVSGHKKAHKATVEYIKKTIISANEQVIFIGHTARREHAEILASMIKEEIKPKDVIISNVYPMSGINIGPGMLAAFYFGTEITDLKHEKEIIDEITSKL